MSFSVDNPRVILVCGATGHTGSAVVDAVLQENKCPVQVRALMRDPTAEAAQKLAKSDGPITLVTGNFDDPASLEAAFQGVHACYLCCANQPEQVALETNVIDAAERSDTCKYLVKIGTCGAKGPTPDTPDYTSLHSVVEYGRFHAAIEERLSKCDSSKLAWTCLRPNYFMQNHVGDIFATLPKK